MAKKSKFRKYLNVGFRIFVVEFILGIIYFVFRALTESFIGQKITLQLGMGRLIIFFAIVIFVNLTLSGFIANKLWKWE